MKLHAKAESDVLVAGNKKTKAEVQKLAKSLHSDWKLGIGAPPHGKRATYGYVIKAKKNKRTVTRTYAIGYCWPLSLQVKRPTVVVTRFTEGYSLTHLRTLRQPCSVKRYSYYDATPAPIEPVRKFRMSSTAALPVARRLWFQGQG